MNIYFAGSIKGSSEGTEIIPKLIEILSEHGTVLTEHLGKVHLDPSLNIAQTEEGIYAADKDFLDRSDVLVAEITGPSHGVGWEISYAQWVRDIPVICLYKEGSRVSSMLAGNPGIQCYGYSTIEHIEQIVSSFIQQYYDGDGRN